jgi:hypothetical protein
MITIKLKGNFGNWLNQYSYARLLAEETGYKLLFFNPKIENHPITKILKEYFPDIRNLDGVIKTGKALRIRNRFSSLDGKMLNNIRGTNLPLFLLGDFEIYGLLSKEKQNRIKTVLQCKQDLDKNNLDNNILNFYLFNNKKFVKTKIEKINSDDLVINLRLGDFLSRHWDRLLLFEYFEQFISKVKYNRIFIVAQSEILDVQFYNFFCKDFDSKFHPIYSINNTSGNFMHDFNLVRLFDNIAISQSSFSWWAALLSDAKKIYFPVPNLGPWSYERSMHIRMVNEPRYEYIREDPYGTILRQTSLMSYYRYKNTGFCPSSKSLKFFKANRREK